MAPPHPKPTPSGEVSIIVALMEQIEGLRNDFKTTTETIVKKVEDQGKDTAKKLEDHGKDTAQKIDALAMETRTEIRELREDFSEMKTRLARGSERMENMRKDLDNQGSKCVNHQAAVVAASSAATQASQAAQAAAAAANTANTTANAVAVAQAQAATSALTRKEPSGPKFAWWVVLLVGGVLAYTGERLAKFVFNGLADPPAVGAPSAPVKP